MNSLALYNGYEIVRFEGQIEIDYKTKHEKTDLKNANDINYSNLSGTRYTVEAKIYNYTPQQLEALKEHWQDTALLKIDDKNEGKYRFWSPKIGYYEDKYNKVPYLFIKCISSSYIADGKTIIRWRDTDVYFSNTQIFFSRK